MIGRRQILSQLHGVPIAVKDLCWTAGIATAAGMPLHRDFVPSVDATVVRKLREAGAILLGKLQLTEGAFADHHPTITPPVNPWHARHWSGASSSGSGVATAAGLCFGSLGSDTGGSIRFPSAANGMTGLKPTWGRVSRFGCFELAASLDHIGPMCRSATDAAHHARRDRRQRPERSDGAARRGARLPRRRRRRAARHADRLRRALRARRRRGRGAPRGRGDARDRALARRRDRPLRFPEVGADDRPTGACNCAVETAVAHDGDLSVAPRANTARAGRADRAGRGTGAASTTSASCCAARLSPAASLAAMAPVDAMLVPAQPIAAPTVARMTTLGQVPAELAALIRYTAPFDMSGHPTLTLPAGVHRRPGLPVATQFVGKPSRRGRRRSRRPRFPARTEFGTAAIRAL